MKLLVQEENLVGGLEVLGPPLKVGKEVEVIVVDDGEFPSITIDEKDYSFPSWNGEEPSYVLALRLRASLIRMGLLPSKPEVKILLEEWDRLKEARDHFNKVLTSMPHISKPGRFANNDGIEVKDLGICFPIMEAPED